MLIMFCISLKPWFFHVSNWVSLIYEDDSSFNAFYFPFPFPFKSCLISRGISLISWTSLNAWNESEIILIMNIELIQFIKKHLRLNMQEIVFKKLYLQMHVVGWHFHCYTPWHCKNSFQKYPRLPKKECCAKKSQYQIGRKSA